MKQLSIFFFTLLSFCLSAQYKEAHEIKIYLEDAETGKNIADAKVTLEGFEVPAIPGEYDREGKYYYFKNVDYSKYALIYLEHKNKEPQVFNKKKIFPNKLYFELLEKRTTIETNIDYNEDINIPKGDTIINSIHRDVSTVDHYKTLLLLKNSSDLTFFEIKTKIDSLVEPYGLEYIDDLVPKMYFIRFYGSQFHGVFAGENSIICNINENKSLKGFFKENPDRINFIKTHPLGEDEYTITDFFSENEEFYNNVYDWKKNCYVLPYRKKNKAPFRLENDPLIYEIKRHSSQLEFGKIRYDKFEINEHVPTNEGKLSNEITDFTGKMSANMMKQLDAKIMNYKFLKKYNNDSTRVLFMDYNIQKLYLDKSGIHEIRDLDIQMVHWSQTKWKHSFLLDEEILYPEKQMTDFSNKTDCTVQRYIGYTFLFD